MGLWVIAAIPAQVFVTLVIAAIYVIAQLVSKARQAKAFRESQARTPPPRTGGGPAAKPRPSPEQQLQEFLAELAGTPPPKREPAPRPQPAPPPVPAQPARTPAQPAQPRPQPAAAPRPPPPPPVQMAPQPRPKTRPRPAAARAVPSADQLDEARLLREGLTSALRGPKIGAWALPDRTRRKRRPPAIRGLKGKDGLRRAVVAREVLGPPISLKDDPANRKAPYR
ncbi:MAG: hypothetical protein JXR37_19650 [Kiritimatiellae bacterium]|nr:hypothetical protein [Kiritimatiellia bacterium]